MTTEIDFRTAINEALDAVDAEVEERIVATVQAAKAGPFPDPGAPVSEFKA